MRRNDRIGGVEGEESERGERWTRRGVLLRGRVGGLAASQPRGEGGSDGSQPAAEPLQGGAGHRSTLRSCGYVPSVRRTKGCRTRGAPLTRAPTPSSAKPPVEPRGGAAARGSARVVLGNWGARGVAGPKGRGGAVDASRERGPLQLFTPSRGPSANQWRAQRVQALAGSSSGGWSSLERRSAKALRQLIRLTD